MFQNIFNHSLIHNCTMNNEGNNKNGNEMQLELRPDIAGGVYSNLAIITHSHSEFILDFARMLPGMPKPDICSRVVMAPEHAKRLLRALEDNISKYESNFGPINDGNKASQSGRGTFNLGDLSGFNNGTKS